MGPNFQNIPIKTEEVFKIRKAFRSLIHGLGNISADYSQIELRIMAHLPVKIKYLLMLLIMCDIHSRTAADVYNVSIDDVQPHTGLAAKIVNFGSVFGMALRMSQELGIPQKEAKALIEKYFATYSGIQKYVEDTMENAKKNHLFNQAS